METKIQELVKKLGEIQEGLYIKVEEIRSVYPDYGIDPTISFEITYRSNNIYRFYVSKNYYLENYEKINNRVLKTTYENLQELKNR